VIHRIKAGWLKWRNFSLVLCDHRKKLYRMAIRPPMLYASKYCTIKKNMSKMTVAKMRIVRWMSGNTLKVVFSGVRILVHSEREIERS